jgi:curved DNA-binding protein CbpA
MPDPYQQLGLPYDADDAAIRSRYLERTREFPPEHYPQESAAYRAAYEQIRTLDDRTEYWLYRFRHDDDLDQLIEEVRCTNPRPFPNLLTLLNKRKPKKS